MNSRRSYSYRKYPSFTKYTRRILSIFHSDIELLLLLNLGSSIIFYTNKIRKISCKRVAVRTNIFIILYYSPESMEFSRRRFKPENT